MSSVFAHNKGECWPFSRRREKRFIYCGLLWFLPRKCTNLESILVCIQGCLVIPPLVSSPHPLLSSSFVQPPPLFHPCFTQILCLAVVLFLCVLVWVHAFLCSPTPVIENRTKRALPDPDNAVLFPRTVAVLYFTLYPWTRPLLTQAQIFTQPHVGTLTSLLLSWLVELIHCLC